MFKTFIKSKITDRNLLTLRKQISKYITKDSKIIEIGCGTGSLLFLLSSKIKEGLGIDISSSMIKFCIKKARKENIKNISFVNADANYLNQFIKKHYDIAIIILIMHEINRISQINILKKTANIADKIVIADYTLKNSIFTKF